MCQEIKDRTWLTIGELINLLEKYDKSKCVVVRHPEAKEVEDYFMLISGVETWEGDFNAYPIIINLANQY